MVVPAGPRRQGGVSGGPGSGKKACRRSADRLHGDLDLHTPAERYDGTPFTARGFERVPALDHLQGWLANLMTV